MHAPGTSALPWVPALFLAGGLVGVHRAQQPPEHPPPPDTRLGRAAAKELLARHRTRCHDGGTKQAGLDLGALSGTDVVARPGAWEKVARNLAARQIPPAGRPRPD